MQRKKIVLTVTNDLLSDQRMERIATSLYQRFEVLLIGRCYSDSPPLPVQPYRQTRLRCYFRSGKAFYIEYHFRLFFFLFFQHKADVYAAVDLDTVMPCWFAARLFRRKVILDAHEWFTEVPEVERRPLIRRIWLAIEKIFIPRLDGMYTVSESIARHYTSTYLLPVAVIRNVPKIPPADALSFPSPVKGPFILYQGAVNEGRGLEQLIQSAPRLPLPVVIAGDGDIFTELSQLAAQSPAAGAIFFTGRLSPAQLRSLTKQAWLGINLLESRSKSYYFSLANKFFDYPTAGIPQLCMNFPEYQKVNEACPVALLLSDIQPDAIADAINRLWDDMEKYSQLQVNCSLFSRTYHWGEEEKKLMHWYEQLLG